MAFWNNIPERVSFIGEGAFDGCFDLTIHAPADSYAAKYAEANWIAWAEENVCYPQRIKD